MSPTNFGSWGYFSVVVEEEEEFYDGPDDESDYDSDDSNGTLLPPFLLYSVAS